jgi:hypothetical protein
MLKKSLLLSTFFLLGSAASQPAHGVKLKSFMSKWIFDGMPKAFYKKNIKRQATFKSEVRHDVNYC